MSPKHQQSSPQGWKFQPPQPGEMNHKIVGDTTYFWCEKCKKGSGVWGGHATPEHVDNSRDLNDHRDMLMVANNRQSGNEVSRKHGKNRLQVHP